MRNHFGRVFERLINLLLPPPGHRRAAVTPPTTLPRVRDPYVWPMTRGDEVGLMPERRLERHECRCQAGLRCAVHALAVST